MAIKGWYLPSAVSMYLLIPVQTCIISCRAMLAICMTLAAIAQDGCYVSQEESISLQPYIVQWCHRICAEGLAGPCSMEPMRTDATYSAMYAGKGLSQHHIQLHS